MHSRRDLFEVEVHRQLIRLVRRGAVRGRASLGRGGQPVVAGGQDVEDLPLRAVGKGRADRWLDGVAGGGGGYRPRELSAKGARCKRQDRCPGNELEHVSSSVTSPPFAPRAIKTRAVIGPQQHTATRPQQPKAKQPTVAPAAIPPATLTN